MDRSYFHPPPSGSNSSGHRNQRQFAPRGPPPPYQNSQFFNNSISYGNEYGSQVHNYHSQQYSSSDVYGTASHAPFSAPQSFSYFPPPSSIQQAPRGNNFAPPNASYFNAGDYHFNYQSQSSSNFRGDYQSGPYGRKRNFNNPPAHNIPKAAKTNNNNNYAGGGRPKNWGRGGAGNSATKHVAETHRANQSYHQQPSSSGQCSNFANKEEENGEEDYCKEVKPDFRDVYESTSGAPMPNSSDDEEEEDENSEDIKPASWRNVGSENSETGSGAGPSNTPSTASILADMKGIGGLTRSTATLGKNIAEDQILAAYKQFTNGQRKCKKLKNMRANFKWIKTKDDLRNLERYGKIFGTAPRAPGETTSEEKQKLRDIYASTLNLMSAKSEIKALQRQRMSMRKEVHKMHAIREAANDPENAAVIANEILNVNEERIRLNNERRAVHLKRAHAIQLDVKRYAGKN